MKMMGGRVHGASVSSVADWQSIIDNKSVGTVRDRLRRMRDSIVNSTHLSVTVLLDL